MEWLIWVPDHGETPEVSGVEFECDQHARFGRSLADLAEYAAEKYADQAWSDWAWELKPTSWPIDFRLRHVETGLEYDVDVHLELEPSFSTGVATRVWRGDEIYLAIARHYAPREARR